MQWCMPRYESSLDVVSESHCKAVLTTEPGKETNRNFNKVDDTGNL